MKMRKLAAAFASLALAGALGMGASTAFASETLFGTIPSDEPADVLGDECTIMPEDYSGYWTLESISVNGEEFNLVSDGFDPGFTLALYEEYDGDVFIDGSLMASFDWYEDRYGISLVIGQWPLTVTLGLSCDWGCLVFDLGNIEAVFVPADYPSFTTISSEKLEMLSQYAELFGYSGYPGFTFDI